MGFMCIDKLAQKLDVEVNKKKFNALYKECIIAGEKVVLLKPQTYMNLSGESIKKAVVWYKPDLKNIIVIYDDLDLEVGKIRIRKEGSAGTHNGAKSVIKELGSTSFPRIRVGIGESKWDTKDYVLSNISKEDEPCIEEAVGKVTLAVEDIIINGVEHAMRIFN